MNKLPIKKERLVPEIEAVIDCALKNGGYVCGGYARYLASPNLPHMQWIERERQLDKEHRPVLEREDNNILVFPNDVDIFCENKNAQYHIGSALRELGLGETSSTLISSNFEFPANYPLKIQLIHAGKIPSEGGRERVLFGTPEEIIGAFDFTITQAAIIDKEQVLVCDEFEEHESKKVLKATDCAWDDVLHLFGRLQKYMELGYQPTALDMTRLFTRLEQEVPTLYKEIQTKFNNFGMSMHKVLGSSSAFKEVLAEAYNRLVRRLMKQRKIEHKANAQYEKYQREQLERALANQTTITDGTSSGTVTITNPLTSTTSGNFTSNVK